MFLRARRARRRPYPLDPRRRRRRSASRTAFARTRYQLYSPPSPRFTRVTQIAPTSSPLAIDFERRACHTEGQHPPISLGGAKNQNQKTKRAHHRHHAALGPAVPVSRCVRDASLLVMLASAARKSRGTERESETGEGASVFPPRSQPSRLSLSVRSTTRARGTTFAFVRVVDHPRPRTASMRR